MGRSSQQNVRIAAALRSFCTMCTVFTNNTDIITTGFAIPVFLYIKSTDSLNPSAEKQNTFCAVICNHNFASGPSVQAQMSRTCLPSVRLSPLATTSFLPSRSLPLKKFSIMVKVFVFATTVVSGYAFISFQCCRIVGSICYFNPDNPALLRSRTLATFSAFQ